MAKKNSAWLKVPDCAWIGLCEGLLRHGSLCIAMAKVFLYVEIDVKVGMRTAFIEKLAAHGANVRREDGCERLDILFNTENEDKVCVYEIWSNRAAWDAHMGNSASSAWRPVAEEYVVGENITVMGPAPSPA